MTERSLPYTVGILVFPDVEVLDFAGPFEVFSIARRPDDDTRLFDVQVIGTQGDTIACRNGLRVVPDIVFDRVDSLDILVVPGGRGTDAIRDRPDVIDWIRSMSHSTAVTASVCTGASVLAHGGLLRNRPATTHWGAIGWLRDRHPDIDVRENVRYVDDGAIVTAAGVSAGIDMSLHLVARFIDRPAAVETARNMEYEGRWDAR